MARASGSRRLVCSYSALAGGAGGERAGGVGVPPHLAAGPAAGLAVLLPTAVALSSMASLQILRCSVPAGGGEAPQHPHKDGVCGWAQLYALQGSVCLVLMAPTGWGQHSRPRAGCAPEGQTPGARTAGAGSGGDTLLSFTLACFLEQRVVAGQTSACPLLAALSLGWDRATSGGCAGASS